MCLFWREIATVASSWLNYNKEEQYFTITSNRLKTEVKIRSSMHLDNLHQLEKKTLIKVEL